MVCNVMYSMETLNMRVLNRRPLEVPPCYSLPPTHGSSFKSVWLSEFEHFKINTGYVPSIFPKKVMRSWFWLLFHLISCLAKIRDSTYDQKGGVFLQNTSRMTARQPHNNINFVLYCCHRTQNQNHFFGELQNGHCSSSAGPETYNLYRLEASSCQTLTLTD